MGKPPGVGGDSRSLTITGIYESLQNVNLSLLTNKEAFDELWLKFKSYDTWLQVSSDLDSQRPEKIIIQRPEKTFWTCFQRTATIKEVHRFRGPSRDSCSTMDFNYSKVKQIYCSGVKHLDGCLSTSFRRLERDIRRGVALSLVLGFKCVCPGRPPIWIGIIIALWL